MLQDKELRGYIGAATVFLLVMGLLLFLAFFEIPETNNDIFKVIVGMLVGSLSVVTFTLLNCLCALASSEIVEGAITNEQAIKKG